MNYMWKKQNRLIIFIFFFIFIAITSLIWYTIFNITNHNNSMTSELIINSKKIYMKESIDNFIIRMETLEKRILSATENHVLLLHDIIIQNALQNSDLEYLITMLKLYNQDFKFLNGLIYDIENKEFIFSTVEHMQPLMNFDDRIKTIKNNAAIFDELETNHYKIILYVNWDTIYELAKENIYIEIHNMTYLNNQYIWVNEIINYDGGDDYAIRLIHPNLQDSEGEYLSTNTVDIVGNLPYLTELNGINEQGEIFSSYYFKNLNNDKITEKISYAKLYEKYDWIISTGIPLEDLDTHTSIISQNNIFYILRDTLLIFIIFVIGFLGILYFLIKKQKKYVLDLEGFVKKETEIDILTGAFTRKYGNHYLNKMYHKFSTTGITSFIFILDIDDFKLVNDTYGHSTGDVVLKKVTQTILSMIDPNDHFIRWGGEEFVLVIHNSSKEHVQQLTNTIVNHIFNIEFENSNQIFHISISIGGSLFINTDMNFEVALKRADAALYHVKNHGKNASFLDFVTESN